MFYLCLLVLNVVLCNLKHKSPSCCTVVQVEASQSMILMVGLSATLPNHKRSFLGVTESGLFYFDASYRPVPLAMQFIGATDKNSMASKCASRR